ncbi:cell division protein ZipA [Marinobacter sp. V034]|uniref:cell division protein ZipA n=1 Tax=Marinobacter sp. V034 TaxID=3459610 RepID=UPI004043FEC4
MSLREWLIAIGALFIVGIVVDGVRRMRRARKEAIEISSGMGADEIDGSPIDEGFNPELPNGGARPVSASTLAERGYFRNSGKSRFASPPQKPTRPVVADKHKSDQPVEADERWKPSDIDEDVAEEMVDTGYSEPVESFSAEDDKKAAAYDEDWADDGWSGESRGGNVDAGNYDEPEGEDEYDVQAQDEVFDQARPDNDAPDVEEDTASRHIGTDPDKPKAGANRPDAQEVIVINVQAKPDNAYEGKALGKLFDACGLEFGDMDIYHRHEETNTTSPVQFSVANAVEPGTFRASDLKDMKSPGISFFMSLPGPSDSLKAFEFMLETAQCVIHNLGGELKDERRSVMTPQTIEHCRQRIREFERKRRSQRTG